MKEIPLTQGRVALVDDADYEWLNQWKWYAVKYPNNFYAVSSAINIKSQKYKRIRMHRLILNTPKNMDTDHANHNGLDNQRHNIRICTTKQNTRNRLPRRKCSSLYKGVSWNKKVEKWIVFIANNRKNENLGCFDDEIKAAIAYDAKAKELFGKFAYLNFP